ncbi:MAG: helix-turn-helix domain-containing protein, partial [Kiritimatiellales bacterium]
MNDPVRKYKIPAVENMLTLVEFLSNESEPFTISALAKQLGISKNMVFRIVKCLEEQGYLESDGDAG